MKFDWSKLNELNEVDFENVGGWPFEIKVFMAVIAAVFVAAGSYWFLVHDKLPVLEKHKQEEKKLKLDYQSKYRLAVNLEEHKRQMATMEKAFSDLLKQLPTQNETPGLLDDITFVGTSNGLVFRMIAWQDEVQKEFYTELPISIQVQGGYHAIGDFVGDVAGLPRIVSTHDFLIDRDGDNELNFQLLAKTYRYKEASQ